MKKSAFILILSILFVSCKNDKEVKTATETVIDSTTASKGQNPDSISNQNDSVSVDEDYIQKATINKSDSIIWIVANMKLDHRIFGYEKPDVNSKKMILYSIFTNDVEGNPYKCPYGSYYQTAGYQDMLLKFQSFTGDFAKVKIITDVRQHTVYFEKKWVEFEED